MMNYSLILSLEHTAAVRVVVTLWKRVDLSILTSLSDDSDETWKELENKVERKLQNLPFQRTFIEKLSCFIKPIRIQILRLFRNYRIIMRNYSELNIEYLISIICLTSKGTIDEGKTAKVLVKDENLDIISRFRLACAYCIEDYIYTLWENLDEKKFYEKNLKLISTHELSIISFWVRYIQGKLDKPYCIEKISPYKYGFECAIGKHDNHFDPSEFLFDTTINEVAVKYFSQKLTFEEKQRELVKYTITVVDFRCRTGNIIDVGNYADVLCFLLSIMSEEQQEKIFKECGYEVLICLLYWPWQIFVAETAERILNLKDSHFSKINYEILLTKIINKTIDGYKDYNYQELLGILWKQSPPRYKKYILYRLTHGSLISDLLTIKDKQNIELILEDTTVRQRKKIIFSEIDSCRLLVCEEEWDLLKFFIKKCISSKYLMDKFKNEFKEFNKNISEKQLEKTENKWDKFSHLLITLSEDLTKGKE